MDAQNTAFPALFIRIIAVVMAYNTYQLWPLLDLGISSLTRLFEGPEFRQTLLFSIGYGSLTILYWLLGLATSISLLLLKPFSRWMLLIYFIAGIFFVQVSWLPYVGYVMDLFENIYLKIISLEIPNLIIVIATFILFNKQKSIMPREEAQHA